MDRFHTIVNIKKPEFSVDYHTKCLFLGSCFAASIGSKMQRLRFPAILNPFGVLYNPVSISDSLKIIMSDSLFTPDDLYFHNEMWFSLSHYTAFDNPDRDEYLFNINESLKDARIFMKECNVLLITFGTAWVYKYLKTGKIAANCHKLPSSAFERQLLKPGEIVEIYDVKIMTGIAPPCAPNRMSARWLL